MRNLTIYFAYPWLLLLIIPAIALTLIPYFFLSKKYRKTRNRICSIVIHCLIMVLAISVLAGIEFRYQVPNEENEVLFLVDVSDTQESVAETRDGFLKTAIDDGRYDGFKVGVVTFGFNQKYAVPLTNDVGSVYEAYLQAETPDSSATDIASALSYAKDLFLSPETAKIVLVTDCRETDEEALGVIRMVAAQGTKVDTAYIPAPDAGNDVSILGVSMPEYHVNEQEDFNISVTLGSNCNSIAALKLKDNGEDTLVLTLVEMTEGSKTVTIPHRFATGGLHELDFEISVNGSAEDGCTQNNVYTTYMYVEVFNKVLVLERYAGQSENIKAILSANEEYDVDVVDITEETGKPVALDELRLYDQIILNNVSNGDLTEYMVEGFDEMLLSYVNDYGGGLLTVGGNDESGNAHSYNRKDMYGTTYQSMLPVQAIDYTPPVGLIVIIDSSGSMDGKPLDSAKEGAAACIEAMTERDYMGVMTLSTDYNVILPLTPCTQEAKIRDAINSIPKGEGGTNFSTSITRAAQALRSLKSIDKRHIIIVTDGEPGDKEEEYLALIENYYKNDNISLSMVLIDMEAGSNVAQKMERATKAGGGVLYASKNHDFLINSMRDDLKADSIKEINIPEGGYYPTIFNGLSPIVQGLERNEDNDTDKKLTFALDGFFGVKVRSNEYLVLTGDYDVPLYAQWKFGNGSVGSFMCDLNGNWSSKLLEDENGKALVRNIVKNLLPTENIHPTEIGAELTEGNYINRLSVWGNLQKGESIKGEIYTTGEDSHILASLNEVTGGDIGDADIYVTMALTSENNYSRCDFVAKRSGVYRIVLYKLNEAGEEITTREIFKSVTYSKEYYPDDENTDSRKEVMALLASRSGGAAIEDLADPSEIYSNFITLLDRSFDPRLAIIITTLVLFLLDIAVRKFKFKWLHEIIRERKAKKSDKK